MNLEKKVYIIFTSDMGYAQIEAVFDDCIVEANYLEKCIERTNQIIRHDCKNESEFERLELTEYHIERSVLQAYSNNLRTTEIIEWLCNQPQNEALRWYSLY